MSARVQSEDFDIAAEIRALEVAASGAAQAGAVVTFTGVVRGESGGKQLASITLEHYPGMTEAALAAIEREAGERWPLVGCRIVHRIGTLAPGANIVLVVTSSAHREAAFEAARFLMDYLKTRAPFWKKERFIDGTERWVEARADDEAAADRWRPTGPK